MIFGFFRNRLRDWRPVQSPTFTTTEPIKPFKPVETITREETIEVRSRTLNKRESREFATIIDWLNSRDTLLDRVTADQFVFSLVPPSATATNAVWAHDRINERIRVYVYDNDKHRDLSRYATNGQFTLNRCDPHRDGIHLITVYTFHTMAIPTTPEDAP